MPASVVIDRWDKRDLGTGYQLRYLLKRIRCGRCRQGTPCSHGPYLYVRKLEVAGEKRKIVERYVGRPGSAAFTRAMTV